MVWFLFLSGADLVTIRPPPEPRDLSGSPAYSLREPPAGTGQDDRLTG
jgi:hypothetical protein